MAKKFYGSNADIFWTLETQLPKSHVEAIIKDWFELKNNIQWDSITDRLTLISAMIPPTYIKATDGVNSFYFFYAGMSKVEAAGNGVFYYHQEYVLDRYMTHYWAKLQAVLSANPYVQFVRKFYDRFLYTVDASSGKIATATIDFFKQIQYLKTPADNVAIVRNYAYGSTAQSLYARQTYNGAPWGELPPNITFTPWDNSTQHNITRPSADFFTPNQNNRYLYLILKSSAKIDSTYTDKIAGKSTHSTNTKLILPLFAGQEDSIINLLFNFKITDVYPCLIDASADNIVGFFESEIPPALIAGAALNGQGAYIQQHVGFMSQTYTPESAVVFFEVPHNYALRFQLSSSNDGSGISTRLNTIFENAQDRWDVDTEPLFLTDVFYREIHALNQSDRLETSMSLISLTITGDRYINAGVNVHSYEFFDGTQTSTYFYTDNDGANCTNELNPVWNTNKSNRTTSLSLAGGLYDSASANYYATNATTQYTSIQNRKSEETQSWVDYGVDTGLNLLKLIGQVVNKDYGGALRTGGIIAKDTTNNIMRNARANRQVASNIKNIESSPASTVSSPYISISVPNDVVNGNYLFNTYKHEISEFDKLRIFIDYANSGYPCNDVAPISTFINRQYCNILDISTEICANLLWHILTSQPVSIFNNQRFNSEFIAWLNTPHMFFTNNEILNHFNPAASDYIPNLELVLPSFPDQNTDITKIIDEAELGIFEDLSTYTDAQVWTILTRLNPRLAAADLSLTDFTVENIISDTGRSRYNIRPKPNIPYTGLGRFSYLRPTVRILNANTWVPATAFNTCTETSWSLTTGQTYFFNNIDTTKNNFNGKLTISYSTFTSTVNVQSYGYTIITDLITHDNLYPLYWGTATWIPPTFTDDAGFENRTIPLTTNTDAFRTNFLIYERGTPKATITIGSFNAEYTDHGFQRNGRSGDSFNGAELTRGYVGILYYSGHSDSSYTNGSRFAIRDLAGDYPMDAGTIDNSTYLITRAITDLRNGSAVCIWLYMSLLADQEHVYIAHNGREDW